jgi:DNA replication protein DnaC
VPRVPRHFGQQGASQWVDRLAEAHTSGRLQAELIRLTRYRLLVVDEVGYIPFEPEAANLFFELVSSRYERASLIVTDPVPEA